MMSGTPNLLGPQSAHTTSACASSTKPAISKRWCCSALIRCIVSWFAQVALIQLPWLSWADANDDADALSLPPEADRATLTAPSVGPRYEYHKAIRFHG